MSWRLIFVILLLAAGASAWGGLQLGDWLVAHGPTQAPPTPATQALLATDADPVLDASGKPHVATAPQPLPDGRQGVPQLPPPTDWQVQAVSLLAENRPIALATTTISMDEAIALAQGEMPEPDGLQGIAEVGNLGGRAVAPIDVTVPPAPPAPEPNETGASDASWQVAFQAELKACAQQGFFSRPSCAWAARNKYCEPNNAWGKAKDCPARGSNF